MTWRGSYYTEVTLDCFLPELWPFVSFSHLSTEVLVSAFTTYWHLKHWETLGLWPFIPFRVDPFLKGDKNNFDSLTSPESVPIPFYIGRKSKVIKGSNKHKVLLMRTHITSTRRNKKNIGHILVGSITLSRALRHFKICFIYFILLFFLKAIIVGISSGSSKISFELIQLLSALKSNPQFHFQGNYENYSSR